MTEEMNTKPTIAQRVRTIGIILIFGFITLTLILGTTQGFFINKLGGNFVLLNGEEIIDGNTLELIRNSVLQSPADQRASDALSYVERIAEERSWTVFSKEKNLFFKNVDLQDGYKKVFEQQVQEYKKQTGAEPFFDYAYFLDRQSPIFHRALWLSFTDFESPVDDLALSLYGFQNKNTLTFAYTYLPIETYLFLKEDYVSLVNQEEKEPEVESLDIQVLDFDSSDEAREKRKSLGDKLEESKVASSDFASVPKKTITAKDSIFSQLSSLSELEVSEPYFADNKYHLALVSRVVFAKEAEKSEADWKKEILSAYESLSSSKQEKYQENAKKYLEEILKQGKEHPDFKALEKGEINPVPLHMQAAMQDSLTGKALSFIESWTPEMREAIFQEPNTLSPVFKNTHGAFQLMPTSVSLNTISPNASEKETWRQDFLKRESSIWQTNIAEMKAKTVTKKIYSDNILTFLGLEEA